LKLAETVRTVGLNYVVITSVTRDDLPDGGASFFAQCIGTIRKELPDCGVEVLIPDFRGNDDALRRVLESRPDVLNHNMEVVPAFFKKLRPGGNYQTSLKLLENIKSFNEAKAGQVPVISKSGFMLGFGESEEDISILLSDLASAGCRSITIGQYQQPTRSHWSVVKYYRPEEFEAIKARAYEMGFSHIESGPLVRSSYRAASTLYSCWISKNHI
jgi:lipoic acid synthetase